MPAHGKSMKKKILDIINKKNKSKIVSLAAYSKNIASIIDNFCDIILVGDSLGSVLYNYKSTREVTLNAMIEHSKSVRMGIKKSLMVVDMPHNTYRNSKEALKNAKKIMLKTKCDAVKLEGGKKIYNVVKVLTKNNIPVMGHLGLLPQSDKTFKFKGKKVSERNKILKDAELLQSAGAFSIVLECVETSLSKMVTKKINIPTIGIGASNNCDGQILVFDDLIGLNPINVRFVKKYSNIRKEIAKAVSSYAKEVRNKKFPLKKHSY
jgi:3-methyl-2-oxobutanoate hydroxymethyltransferase